MRIFRAALVMLVFVPATAVAGSEPNAPACPIFPANNVWHADVSALPVHERSAAWITSMGGSGRHIHPDFGPSDSAQPYGIPYDVVAGSHAKVSVDFYYPDESDAGPYPLGSDITIEEGSDHHALMLDKDACRLYEVYDVSHDTGGWHGGSGAVFDLNSNELRPAGWTSADAAGLPIFAGLIRRDEIDAGVIDHAIRMTASQTDRSYLWPARHQAGALNDPNLPPMGARFRLKSSFSTAGFSTEARIVLDAMNKFGLLMADNGSDWYFGGASQNGWSGEVLDELKSVTAGSFEAVDESSLMGDPNSGQAKTGPVGALSIAVSRATGVYGTSFTFSGSLACQGLPVPGGGVALRRANGSAAGTAQTSAGGAWQVAIKPAASDTYRASWNGDATCTGGALSAGSVAGVRVGIAFNAAKANVPRGATASLSGRVLPGHPGRRVILQLLNGSSKTWTNVASTALDGLSAFRFSYRKATAGFLVFRAAFPTQDANHLWNVSRSIRVDWE